MKNADKPAMPCKEVDPNPNSRARVHENHGLTKREMFAMNAMQGLVTQRDFCNSKNDIEVMVQWSVKCADALLAELEK